jgi:hypothetical protein
MARDQNKALQKQMPWLFGTPSPETETSGTKQEAWTNYESAKAYIAGGM